MPLGLYNATLNFETIDEIGQEGRNSQVFLAHDKQLDGNLVVKKIPKDKLLNAQEYYKEAKILYMSSHPYVVRVNYGCENDDHIFIAMPFYRNGSLKSLMAKKHLTIREVVRYAIQFLSGLHNIHSKGLIHFDVKPDNILISDSNEALLSDFGLTKAMDDLGFANPHQVYNKQVPPEMFIGSSKTLQYNIYLAGLTLYRMVNGDQNFYDQFNFTTQADYVAAIKEGKFPNRDSYLPHVPQKMRKTINKALEVDTRDRYRNVLDLMNELGKIDDHLDWRYSLEENVKVWSKDLPNKKYMIKLSEVEGGKLEMSTTKTMKESGNTTKVNDHSYSNATKSNITSKLNKVFREL